MSRVSDALKRAENWEGKSVFTGQQKMASSPISTLEPSIPMDRMLSAHQESDPAALLRPSRISLWLRRWRRRIVRTTTLAPRCVGTTRRGLPCRGPAMHNGFCRMHGGARTPRLQERIGGTVGTSKQGATRAIAGIARFFTSRLRPAA
jgi:hypothetical protein